VHRMRLLLEEGRVQLLLQQAEAACVRSFY
jgi:hypothetical protein